MKRDKKIEEKIAKIDKSDMRQIILNFSNQFRIGFEVVEEIKNQIKKIKNVDNVIVCGMGGSALPAELLKIISRNYLINPGTQIHIHRNYGLHRCASKTSLIVCISYSGNTEETLSAYFEAKKRGLQIISISSGGKLLKFSRKNGTPIAIVPPRISPRCALGYQFSVLIKILEELNLIKKIQKDILHSLTRKKIEIIEKSGKKLSKKIINKIPIIYSSQSNKALSYVWKIKFNENSKIPAFCNYFPELNHNEMVGYTLAKDYFYFLFLNDKGDYPRIKTRMALTAELMKKSGFGVEFINLSGKNIWEKIFNNLILADWTSYYLAIANGIDPMPVKIVESLKKKMRKPR